MWPNVRTLNFLSSLLLFLQHLVIDMLCQSLGIPHLKESDCSSVSSAAKAVAPNHFKDHWKLAEGFVVAEGNDILPHLAKSR